MIGTFMSGESRRLGGPWRSGSALAPLALFAPLPWKRPHQHRQRDLRRLPPIQDRLDDIRREQRQAHQARDIGRVDLLRSRQFVDRAVAAGFSPTTLPGHRSP